MMAVRIITGPPKQHMSSPGAASPANISVVAVATESPQVICGSRPRETNLWIRSPNIFQAQIANIAAGVRRGWQRRTTLNRSIGFNADSILSGVAAYPVNFLVTVAAPQRLVRSEVTNIICRLQKDAPTYTLLVEIRQQRHHFKQIVRLQQDFGIVRGAAHSDGQLHLPVFYTRPRKAVH